MVQAVQIFFAGNPAAFFDDLTDDLLLLDDLRRVVEQQLSVSLPLDRSILIRLAAQREPMTFQALGDTLGQPALRSALLEALGRLRRWSVLETSDHGFSLQPIIAADVTQYLQDTGAEVT
jgi:hypothetical protein